MLVALAGGGQEELAWGERVCKSGMVHWLHQVPVEASGLGARTVFPKTPIPIEQRFPTIQPSPSSWNWRTHMAIDNVLAGVAVTAIDASARGNVS